jgi:hypothetical protein
LSAWFHNFWRVWPFPGTRRHLPPRSEDAVRVPLPSLPRV